MTEASRVQKMLNEQNTEIDRLKVRIDALEGLLRFLLKNEQINPVSVNVVQSILKEGDDNE
jgi:CCR4-NOT transcriptional regulation complex NOT5 subunit